jgi:hypothetical protein
MSENEPIKLELQGTAREVHSPILTSAYDKNSLTQIQLDRVTAWSSSLIGSFSDMLVL